MCPHLWEAVIGTSVLANAQTLAFERPLVQGKASRLRPIPPPCTSVEVMPDEAAEQVQAVFREDTFGVVLNPLNGQGAMPNAHDVAIVG